MKTDALDIAKGLAKSYDISPYNMEQLADLIFSGLKTGEIETEKNGASYSTKDIDLWLNNRLLKNTIVLSVDDYKKALYRAFRLLVVADIAKTDFGSSRQRDFGQRWTDFTRGFLGEIGITHFFKNNLGLDIELEEKEVGAVEKFLPKDITHVKERAQWRAVNCNISIKTSKLRSMWLDIGSQLEHSDAFIFIKIGLTTDHLISFFKSIGYLKELVDMAKELGEVIGQKEELDRLCDRIPDIHLFPAYISGFVWKDDFKNSNLIIHETKKKKIIVGGIGLFEKGMANGVEGLGDITPGKHLACLSALRWSKEDWLTLKNKI